MLILGIETSCDETSAAVVEDGWNVLSCVIASSKKDFETVGGVIPEEAARRQQETILPTIEKALKDAKVTLDEIDVLAVTKGPGLLGSLLIGTMTARTLVATTKKPLIPVHHVLGHLVSTSLGRNVAPEFPLLSLSVSGGHSDVWLRTGHTEQRLLGTTLDDAAGECFDKGAQMLGLPYPGGPALAALAESGDELQYKFPTPLQHDHLHQFSFSGLKTSLKYMLRDLGGIEGLNETVRASLAASYQRAIVLHLTSRIDALLQEHADIKEVHLVGGVSANVRLCQEVEALASKHSVICRTPLTLRYCTDNAAMIASAGYFLLQADPTCIEKPWLTMARVAL